MSYVDIAGHQTWHELIGQGSAVVLLHGGFSGAAAFLGQTSVIADAGYRVHVPERRGHAHTPDVEGPFTYSEMADDTIAYLEAQVSGRAALVGWSDGAVIGLLVAQRRPELVSKLVLIGQYYNSEGRSTSVDKFESLLATPAAREHLRAAYDPYSPDGPEHFLIVYRKTLEMYRSGPELKLATLGDIHVPTLVVQGDRDLVTIEHSAAVAAALPDARLAVLPGTHGLPAESPELVNALVLAFLSDQFT